MKLKTNDNVVVLHGKDRGKSGKVLRAYPQDDKVLVEKINMVKKHLKPTNAAPHGGIQDVERPMGVAKVMLVCPHCGKPTRIAKKRTDDGKNVRVCRKCHQVID